MSWFEEVGRRHREDTLLAGFICLSLRWLFLATHHPTVLIPLPKHPISSSVTIGSSGYSYPPCSVMPCSRVHNPVHDRVGLAQLSIML